MLSERAGTVQPGEEKAQGRGGEVELSIFVKIYIDILMEKRQTLLGSAQ